MTMLKWLSLVLLVCGAASAAETASQPASKPAALAEKEFSRAVCHTYTGDYLLYLPEGYGQEKKHWPLMLFLHGSPTRNDPRGEEVLLHGPPMLIGQGKAYPFIVVAPKCPPGKGWNADNLSAMLDDICEKYDVDLDRIYVTGLSMGGFGTWDLAAKFPYRFAAIAPVCGGGDTRDAAKYLNLPIWAFHGAKDSVVPVLRTQEMIDAIKKAGGDPKVTIYPDTDHDSWNQAYDTAELYTWMLSHQLWVPPLLVEAPPYVAGKPVKVKLTSQRPRPIDVSIVVEGQASPIKTTVTADDQTVEIPTPAGATGAIELTMTLDGRQTQKYWLAPAAIQVPRVSNIQLDGKLDDWPAASRLGDHALISTTTENFLPDIHVGWAPEGLYLAVRMQANETGDATPETFWRGPNMEVFVDPAGIEGKGWPKTSHQFLILPVKDGEAWRTSIGEWKRSDAIPANIMNDARCKSAITVTDGVMTIEWFIPAEALGAAPKAGQSWRGAITLTASIPHRPERTGAWPRSKDFGLLDGVEQLGEFKFVDSAKP